MNNFNVGSAKVFYTIDSTVKNIQNKEKTLTSTQTIMIANALKQVGLDSRENNHIKITILSEDNFKVVINNKTVIKVGKNQADVLEVIVEKIIKSLFSSIKNLFGLVTNLFYKPSFVHAGLKERSYDQAVREDYRSLRKGFEAGQAWMRGRDGSDEVAEQLKTAVKSGKRIENALNSRSPDKAMKKTVAKFADDIGALKANGQLIIPTAYVTSTGALQPVMLQFKKDGGGRLSLEIYADHIDAGSRIQPTQVRQFNDSPSTEQISSVLSVFLQPLLMKGDQRALHNLSKSNETFAALYQEQRAQKMQQRAPGSGDSPARVAQDGDKRALR